MALPCAAQQAAQKRSRKEGDIGDMQSLRLQMAMDRRSKPMSTLSNLLKKKSKTERETTQNLK